MSHLGQVEQSYIKDQHGFIRGSEEVPHRFGGGSVEVWQMFVKSSTEVQ